jgi:protein-tyrosine kinase
MDASNNIPKLFFKEDELSKYSGKVNGCAINNISEEFRAAKRELLMHAFPKDSTSPKMNRIMVTSINEGDGKTFCALNLARSISFEQDKQVLLIDVNVLSPTFNQLVTPKPSPGLIDYLTDSAILVSDIIYPTNIERLRLLPMGSNHHLANELLTSKTMLDLMTDFRERYSDRIVFFDAPPLLGVNEAQTLSHHVDQIIIVINEGTVKTSDLKQVQATLPKNVKVHYILNRTLTKQNWKSKSTDNQDEFSENDKCLTGSSLFN